jgi:transcriptional regulator of acetoin/glycerol metabolism
LRNAHKLYALVSIDEKMAEKAGIASGSNPSLTDAEARLIPSILERTGGNIAAASRLMGIGRNTLYRKLRSQMVRVQ